MNNEKKINSALISVFDKSGLEQLISTLHQRKISIYSTGGTYTFIRSLGYEVNTIEELTGYPSILGGRVKTLHPKVFGGILFRRDREEDKQTITEMEIPSFDLVIVDLYPFQETVKSGANHEEIIEKIDIGGISLIRAAAKNYSYVVILSSKEDYPKIIEILNTQSGSSTLNQRQKFAEKAFHIVKDYDTNISTYFSSLTSPISQSSKEIIPGFLNNFEFDLSPATHLRYGENPHQKGTFYGKLDEFFLQINGKELSYNNLVDSEAAVQLLSEFNETVFLIIKHTNCCGVAIDRSLKIAYTKALSCDPVSAFGGVLACNRTVDYETAEELNKLFFEIIIAPDYESEALKLLSTKKNRIILKQKLFSFPQKEFKSLLNGVLEQDKNLKIISSEDMKTVTQRTPDPKEISAMLFANKIVKHSKSNTIVLSTKEQLLASGVGQTSRVDALKQAINKAQNFGFDLKGSVMASDAFFPFADCVEIAWKEGITAVIQPGGSVRDKESIDFCNSKNMAMVFTGTRNFKH